jgi:S1-C subfamily serine protease
MLKKLKNLISLYNQSPKLLSFGKGLAKGALFLLFLYLAVRLPEAHRALVRAKVGPKVIMIVNAEQTSGGTGFYVKARSGKTFIVTNSHVCNMGPQRLYAELPDSRFTKLKLREISRVTDLCILESNADIEGLELSSDLNVGQQVEILGHPRLFPLTSTTGEYTGDLYKIQMPMSLGKCPKDMEGPLSDGKFDTGFFGELDVCMLNVPVAGISTAKSLGGNSGSPVVNWKGDVVGVVFGGFNDNNDALIIPLPDLKEFLKPY